MLDGERPEIPVMDPEMIKELGVTHEGMDFIYNYSKILPPLRYLFDNMTPEDRRTAFSFVRLLSDNLNISGWTLKDLDRINGMRALLRNLLITVYGIKDISPRVKHVTRGVAYGVGILAILMEYAVCSARMPRSGPHDLAAERFDVPSISGLPDGVSAETYRNVLNKILPYHHVLNSRVRKALLNKTLYKIEPEGLTTAAYTATDLDFVIRVLKDGAVSLSGEPLEFDETLLPGVTLARERLGGLAANVLYVDGVDFVVDDKEVKFEKALIETKTVPLRDRLKELVVRGDDLAREEAKNIVRKWWDLQVEMWKRGVVDTGINMLENYGYDDITDNVLLFGYTTITSSEKGFIDSRSSMNILDAFRQANVSGLDAIAPGMGLGEEYLAAESETLRENNVSMERYGDEVRVSVWPSEEELSGEDLYLPLNDPFMVDSREMGRLAPGLRQALGEPAFMEGHISDAEMEGILSTLVYNVLWLAADRRHSLAGETIHPSAGAIKKSMASAGTVRAEEKPQPLPFTLDARPVSGELAPDARLLIHELLSDETVFGEFGIEGGSVEKVTVLELRELVGRDILTLRVDHAGAFKNIMLILYKTGYNLDASVRDPHERAASRLIQMYRDFELRDHAEELASAGVVLPDVLDEVGGVFREKIYSQELEYFTAGGDARVYSNPDRSVVVKELALVDRELIKRSIYEKETDEQGPIKGYRIAEESLGHLFIRFFILKDLVIREKKKDGTVEEKTLPNALVQKHVLVFFKEGMGIVGPGQRRCVGILADAIERGDIETAKMLIREFMTAIRAMMIRGVFDWDVKTENYGWDPSVGQIGSLDAGKFMKASDAMPVHGTVFLRNLQIARKDIYDWTKAVLDEPRAAELRDYFDEKVREAFSASDYEVDISRSVREIEADDEFSEVVRWNLSSGFSGMPVCFSGTEGMRKSAVDDLARSLTEKNIDMNDLEKSFAGIGFDEIMTEQRRSFLLDKPYLTTNAVYRRASKGPYVGVKMREMGHSPRAMDVVIQGRYWDKDLRPEEVDTIRKDIAVSLFRMYSHEQDVYGKLAGAIGLDASVDVTDRLALIREFEKIDRSELTPARKQFLSDLLGVSELKDPVNEFSIAFDKLREMRRYPFDISLDNFIVRKTSGGYEVELESSGSYIRKAREIEVVEHMHDYLLIPYDIIFSALKEEMGAVAGAIFCERVYFQADEGTEIQRESRKALDWLYADGGRSYLGPWLAKKDAAGRDEDMVPSDAAPKTPATIYAVKELIAPKVPFVEYALKTAPWVEEGIFFALPLVVGSWLFGLDSLGTVAVMAASRTAFFFMHEGARPHAPPAGESREMRAEKRAAEYRAPLTVAIDGFLISLLPVAAAMVLGGLPAADSGLASVFTSTLTLTSSFFSGLFHRRENVKAIAAGRSPASLASAPATEKLVEDLEKGTEEEKIYAAQRLGELGDPEAIPFLVRALEWDASFWMAEKIKVSSELQKAIIKSLAKLKRVPLRVRENAEIGTSIVGMIMSSIDELGIPGEKVRVCGPYQRIRIMFDIEGAPKEKMSRLERELRRKFADANVGCNIERPDGETIEIKLSLNVENLTAFWRSLGTMDMRMDDAGNYRKFTNVEMIEKVMQRVQMLLDGIELDMKKVDPESIEYARMYEEYRSLKFFINGDGTNVNPGLINVMRHPEKLRVPSEPVTDESVKTVDGRKLVTYGDSQLILTESVKARQKSPNYTSLNEMFQMAEANPYFVKYLDDFIEKNYPGAEGAKKRIYLARAAGSAFQTSYLLNLMRGGESDDHMFFISRDTMGFNNYRVLGEYVGRISDTSGDDDVEERVKDFGELQSEVEKMIVSIDREDNPKWRGIFDGIWKQLLASGIIEGVKPGERIMVIDEVGHGTYDFVFKHVVETRSLAADEQRFREEVRALMEKKGLSRETAERSVTPPAPIEVGIFIGQSRSSLAGYPDMDETKLSAMSGIKRQRSADVINAVSHGADFMPHPVKVDDTVPLPLTGPDVPMVLEKNEVLVSGYLKALFAVNGIIDYYDNMAFNTVSDMLERSDDLSVRVAAAEALAEFDIPEQMEKALETLKSAAKEPHEELRAAASSSTRKIILKQLKDSVEVTDPSGKIRVKDLKEMLKKIGIVVSAAESPYPEVRMIAEDIISSLGPDVNRNMAVKLRSLPMPPKRILRAAKKDGFIVPVIALGLGKVSMAFQTGAVLKAARESGAAFGLKIASRDLSLFDSNNELYPIESLTRKAELEFGEEGPVYFLHMDTPTIDNVDGKSIEELKKLITRAMEEGYTSIAVDISRLEISGRVLEKDWDETMKPVGVFFPYATRSWQEKNGDLIEEFDFYRDRSNVYLSASEGFVHEGTVRTRNGKIEGIPKTIEYAFDHDKIEIKTEIPDAERFEYAANVLKILQEHIYSESNRLGVEIGMEVVAADLDLSGEAGTGARAAALLDQLGTVPGIMTVKAGREVDPVLAGLAETHPGLGLTAEVSDVFDGDKVRELSGKGVIKADINMGMETIIWKVLEAYCPDVYREVFDEARRKAMEESSELATKDYEADYSVSRNRIMLSYASKILSEKGSENDHVLVNKVRSALYDTRIRMLPRGTIPDRLDASYIVNELSFTPEVVDGLSAPEMLDDLTYRYAKNVFEGISSEGSASRVAMDTRPRLLRAQLSDLLHRRNVFALLGERDKKKALDSVLAKIHSIKVANARAERPIIAAFLGSQGSGKKYFSARTAEELRKSGNNARRVAMEDIWMLGYSRREDWRSMISRFDLKGTLGFVDFLRRIRNGENAFMPFFDQGKRDRFRVIDQKPYMTIKGPEGKKNAVDEEA
ncbi:MAG: hypothetical protein PHT95_01595, partial [Candidatus Omnitrophica bacterium]|nr:hypothetical protein [Candidatus Omnitrophota bacterium]